MTLGMIHFNLILHHTMGMKCAEEPFNMNMFFLLKVSFKMGTFSDPQHTHPGILYWSQPPPPPIESGGLHVYSLPLISEGILSQIQRVIVSIKLQSLSHQLKSKHVVGSCFFQT